MVFIDVDYHKIDKQNKKNQRLLIKKADFSKNNTLAFMMTLNIMLIEQKIVTAITF